MRIGWLLYRKIESGIDTHADDIDTCIIRTHCIRNDIVDSGLRIDVAAWYEWFAETIEKTANLDNVSLDIPALNNNMCLLPKLTCA